MPIARTLALGSGRRASMILQSTPCVTLPMGVFWLWPQVRWQPQVNTALWSMMPRPYKSFARTRGTVQISKPWLTARMDDFWPPALVTLIVVMAWIPG